MSFRDNVKPAIPDHGVVGTNDRLRMHLMQEKSAMRVHGFASVRVPSFDKVRDVSNLHK